MFAVKIGIFYIKWVPKHLSLNKPQLRFQLYSIYRGMLNILNTKSRTGWNEGTVAKIQSTTKRQCLHRAV